MIAALFVRSDGPYADLPGVDLWDASRDAMQYRGPYPVVAHPPCARWGRYARGSPQKPNQFQVGADGGCFDFALAAVRRFGGVLEHPAGSMAWIRYGLNWPPPAGGWVPAGDGLGHTCCVYQSRYGHPAEKRTWLYASRVILEPLEWGPSAAPRKVENLSHRQRELTPLLFASLLCRLAISGARAELPGFPSAACPPPP